MALNFQDLYKKSIENPEDFWKKIPKIYSGLKNQLKF